MTGLAKYLLLCVVVSSSIQAQTANDQATQSLIVNVIDQHGNAARDLAKENFRLSAKRRPIPVLDAHYSLAPRRLVVLVDTSGSMAGNFDNKKWTIARDAVQELLARTHPDVALALLTFSKNVEVKADFAQGRSAIADWLRQRPSQRKSLKGRTALFDGISTALRLLEPKRQGDAIYVVTDGGDNSSHTSKDEVELALLRSGVRLFVFLFSEPTPTEKERSGVNAIVELAGNTGGFVFGTSAHSLPAISHGSFSFSYEYDTRTRERINLYTQMLGIQLNGFYTLRIALSASQKRRTIDLEVTDHTGRIRKDVGFTFRRVLPPEP